MSMSTLDVQIETGNDKDCKGTNRKQPWNSRIKGQLISDIFRAIVLPLNITLLLSFSRHIRHDLVQISLAVCRFENNITIK